jgi:hypothetical protein
MERNTILKESRHYEKWDSLNPASQGPSLHSEGSASERHGITGGDTLDSAACSSAIERFVVREKRVALIAESTAPTCGCASPRTHWSEVVSDRSVRRVYFFCANCEAFGFILIPGESWGKASILDGVSRADLTAAAKHAVRLMPDLPEMMGIYMRVADDVFMRRSRCAEFHIESIPKSIADAAICVLQKRAEEIARDHEAAMRLERQRQATLTFQLESKVRDRKKAARRALQRRPAVERADFPVIARGDMAAGVTIYGLVDPAEPTRIRYVGQARNPAARLAGHISAGREGKKWNWIDRIIAEGRYPDMVLLERARPGSDVDVLERWWIAQMCAKGMADLNTAHVPKALPAVVDEGNAGGAQ